MHIYDCSKILYTNVDTLIVNTDDNENWQQDHLQGQNEEKISFLCIF